MGGTIVSCGKSTGGGAGTKFGGGINCRSGIITGGQHFFPAHPARKTIAKIKKRIICPP